jgi:CheY-like chemotaxis protein
MPARPLQRILFVEDDPDIQTIARMSLEAVGGFRVLACASGSEALERVGPFSPDLILLDVMMPGMDGLATLEALRRLPVAAQVPVVFMTAKVQAQEVARYREIGAVDVIAKPFDPMALPAVVRTIWEGLTPASGAQPDLEILELRRLFAGRLPERLAEIGRVWAEVRTTGWDHGPLRELHRLAHSLAGAGATFGFPEVTRVAGELEHLLKEVLAGPPAGEAGAPEARVEALLAELRTAARS